MKVCRSPEFFRQDMSHEQLLFTWSKHGYKVKYFWKTHETV